MIAGGALSGVFTAILRAITSIPGHACFGVFMGYFYSKAKIAQFNNDSSEKKYLVFALLVPVVTHTIFDFLLLADNNMFSLIWIVFIILNDILAIKLIKNSSKNNVVLSDAFSGLKIEKKQAETTQNLNYSNFEDHQNTLNTNQLNNNHDIQNAINNDSFESQNKF